MNAHEFLFGDKLDRCAEYIVVEALKKNTPEAYREAQDKLAGIRTFLVFLSSEGGTPFPTAILILQNLSIKLSLKEKGLL